MAVSLDQTIVFWDRTAREILGYTAERLVGAKCSEIPSGLGRSGLTAECVDCCACMRYARAGLVPPAVELAMRASWGEVKWLDVWPVVVPWLPDVGTVVVYLFRERVTELEVLHCLALGWEIAYIADERGLSPHTVRNHSTNLRRKLDVTSSLEAVMAAVRMGVLTFDDERRGPGVF